MKIYVVMERDDETKEVSPVSATIKEYTAKILVRELNLSVRDSNGPDSWNYSQHYFYESVDLVDKECLMEFKQ
jgi:hypothetical protein